MKNMQLAEAEAAEAARWKRLCLQELSGIKKLRRKSREPARLPLPPPPPPPQREPEGAVDLRRGRPFPTALLGPPSPPGKEARLRPEPPPPPSRMALCPPPPQLESPFPPGFSSAARPEPPRSPSPPRKRPGDPPGASSEIKALQQTRRLLANARERTRVHTISAAFEALRKQVPCYSYGQKLSKLAILRIACNYILSLARLADLDYSADHSNLSFSECVEQCTRTLQAEGRSKKRKE
ncbi:transcription factor ATOH8 [Anolis sagrei]|uniref:transcription factor ATOH8 n=1 Tax=Anolis sagrei TaxID=38937 RepID=UPI00351FC2E6